MTGYSFSKPKPRPMTGVSWLDAVSALIEGRTVEIEVSRPDDDTLAITAGVRGVVIHTLGTAAFLVPSIASGNTIASRLQDRIAHLDAARFVVDPATVIQAVETALAHLSHGGAYGH